MQSTRGRSRRVATPIHGPPIEGGPPACRLRSIIANATESADGILAKAAPRRGQPAQPASPVTIKRGILTLKSDFWLLFSLWKKVTRHQPAQQAGETAFDFDFRS